MSVLFSLLHPVQVSLTSRGRREARNQWNPCISMPYTVSSFLQRNNGEHASKGPCQAGFSQSFYSILISKDVLQGQGVLKGKTFNWPVSPFSVSLGRLNGVGERASISAWRQLRRRCDRYFSNAAPRKSFSNLRCCTYASLKRFTV